MNNQRNYGVSILRLNITSIVFRKTDVLPPTTNPPPPTHTHTPNQVSIICLYYIDANLVQIHPQVHEISCTQESVTPMPAGSTPKTICAPPFSCRET